MDRLYAPPTGLCLELLGEVWFAYSPLSGETIQLNDESAAVIEVLALAPGTVESVCDELMADAGVDHAELMRSIGGSWMQLLEAGLIAEVHPRRW